MIGRLFQDPLSGTAPHMTIEENLALAYLRSSKGTSSVQPVSARKIRAFSVSACHVLNMGLEDRMNAAGWTCFPVDSARR